MYKLFIEGGPTFMGFLSIVFIVMLAVSVWCTILLVSGPHDALRHRIRYVRSIGLFALVMGILFQLLGLFQMFQAIQELGQVSQAILAGGLKVSTISTLYGMVIYAISILIWMLLDLWLKRTTESHSST